MGKPAHIKMMEEAEAKTAEVEVEVEEEIEEPEVELEAELISDPFNVQNPHKINKHPPGWHLGWKNPRWREHIGWRGWEEVTYDSEIGKNLDEYITDAPRKMRGSAEIDNIVRRGDAVLCRLPIGIYTARIQDRKRRSATRRAATEAAGVTFD